MSGYDYKKFSILYVDDEVMSLKYFARAFEDEFRIHTASSAKDGVEILKEHKNDIGLILSDQRMPGENGVWLFERAREIQPSIIRILATAYSDFDAAIAAVNSGAIYKYITKPWELNELESTLKRGLEFFMVEKERDQLLGEKMSVLHDLMTGDRIVSLGLMTAGMSHHIRNALVPVKTFLDLLPGQLSSKKDQNVELQESEFWTDYYQQVVQKTGKITDLLTDLWSASEKQMFHFSDKVSLVEIIEDVLSQMRPEFESKKISVNLSLPEGIPELTVDRPKFSKLFKLLFQDELVSLPEGSSIEVSAETIDETQDKPSQVQIKVSDDGAGLPQENQRFVFDPFVARSDSPMEYGINLMACYFIVYHHGGRIGAESSEGNGTTFTIRFQTDPKIDSMNSSDSDSTRKRYLEKTLWEKTLASS